MINLHLWRAEWLKTRKRPANWGILIVMLVIMLINIAAITGLALWSSSTAEFREAAQQLLPYPSGLLLPFWLLSLLSNLIAIIFVANSIGSEYSRDTWKMILPRQGSRLGFLITKLIVGVFAMLLLTGMLMIFSQVLAWISAAILGLELVHSTPTSQFSVELKTLAFALIKMIFYAVVTMLATISTRSTVGGIVVGIITFAVVAEIAMIDERLALVLPFIHLQNIYGHWIVGEPGAIEFVNQIFGREIAPATSMLIVLGYMAALLGAAMYLFKRRDMAGN